MNILDKEEYKFLETDERLGKRIILLGYGGSYAYGTNIETSDVDIRGVCLRSTENILLGKDFEVVTNNLIDTAIYTFDKMLNLLSECNPNCIEILGLRKQDYFIITDIGQELLDNKDLFVSKKCINTFGGYATQQLYRLRQKTLDALTPEEYRDHIIKTINGMKEHLENSWHIPIDRVDIISTDEGLKINLKEINNISLDDYYGLQNEISNVIRTYYKNSTRNKKAMEHNKINKHAMHLLRLYMMAIDLLKSGEIITYRTEEHDLLMDIRNGKYSNEDGMMNKDFWNLLSEYEVKFDEAKKISKLPDNPDYDGIDKFRFKVNEFIVDNNL